MKSFYQCIFWLLFTVTVLCCSSLLADGDGSNAEGNSLTNGLTFFAGSDALGSELWVTDGTPEGRHLVRDIMPGPGSSNPAFITMLNGLCYFAATDLLHGQELWKSDGTLEGTVLVKDINPAGEGASIIYMFPMGGMLYFRAVDGIHGSELWRSDGTEEGTVMVKDIAPGAASSAPYGFTVVGTTMYFFASGPGSHVALWKSDGTEEGTVMVKDIMPGVANNTTNFTNMVTSGGLLYFVASDGTHGLELWRSDGTDAGTFMVEDLYPGATGSSPAWLIPMNGLLYFIAVDPADGRGKLWKSDGTAGGIALAADNTTAQPFSIQSPPVVFNNALYFAADEPVHGRELWKSDGTQAGTVLVKDIAPGYTDSTLTTPASSNPTNLVVAGGAIYFSAADSNRLSQLWKSDGTEAGTVLVKQLGIVSPAFNASGFTTLANGSVVFRADDGIHGLTDWITDGTEAGTKMLANVIPDGMPTGPGSLVVMDDVTYYTTSDSSSGSLWRDDGSGAPPVLLKTVASAGVTSDNPSLLTVMDHALYFFMMDSAGSLELWKSDGTAGGTVLVIAIAPQSGEKWYSLPAHAMAAGGRLFFDLLRVSTSDTFSIDGLWQSDGTATGTSRLLATGTGLFYDFTAADGLMYFTRSFPAELWRSDGTVAGTFRVAALTAEDDESPLGGGMSDYASTLAVAGSKVFEVQQSISGPVNVWCTSGLGQDATLTQLGTFQRPVLPSNIPGITPRPSNVKLVGDTLFFAACDATHGYELWKSDGTVAGTVLVKDINTTSSLNSRPWSFTELHGMLFFTADDGVNGMELWKSDGTSAGTVMVKDICPGAVGGNPQNLVRAGNVIYFTANDGVNGYQLWKTDGTADGTVAVTNETDGTGSGEGIFPGQILHGNDSLYFTALSGDQSYVLRALALPVPAVTTLAAANVGSQQADLAAQVNPGGSAVATVAFEYGLTTAYGHRAQVAGQFTGSAQQAAGLALAGLAPGTLYHYRVVAEVEGRADGADMTFTTGYSGNAGLASITPSTGTLDKPVNGTDLRYTLTVNTPTTSITLTPTTADTYATLTINGQPAVSGAASNPIPLRQGYTTVVIKVTADDGTTTAQYTVNVLRQPLNVQFQTSQTTAGEGDGTMSVLVQLSDVAPARISVPYSVQPGAGMVLSGPAADVTVPAGPLVFLPGEQSKRLTILIHDDQRHEATESLVLALGTPAGGAVVGAQNLTTFYITDNDPLPTMALNVTSQLLPAGSPIVLNATVTSVLPVTYAWSLNGKRITTAHGSLYFVPRATLADGGTYTVTATSNAGTATATCEVGVVDTTPHTVVGGGTQQVITQLAAGSGLTFSWNTTTGTYPVASTSVTSKGGVLTSTATPYSTADYVCQVQMVGVAAPVSGGIIHFNSSSTKPVVAAASLPAGQVGVHYQASLAASATPIGTWSASGLPAGLSIDPVTGMVAGWPQVPVVSKTVKVTVTNAAGSTVMSPSPAITITALPAGVAGTWTGLIERRTQVNNDLGSRLALTVTSQGTYTGRITTGATVQAVTGQMSVAGTAVICDTVYYESEGLQYRLALAFSTAGSPPKLSGSLSVTSLAASPPMTDSAQVTGWRAMAGPVQGAGRYSFAMQLQPPDDTDITLPQGIGFGIATVTAAGQVAISGTTGDGSSFTSAAALGTSGECLLYSSFYGGRGTLTGIPRLLPGGAAPAFADSQLVDSAAAPTTWSKQADTTAAGASHYPNGWPTTTLSLQGSKYSPPAAGHVVMGLSYVASTPNARLSVAGASLDGVDPSPLLRLTLKPDGTFAAASNSYHVTLLVAPATGAFSGGWTQPSPISTSPAAKPVFRGQIVRFVGQAPEYQGVGFFLLPQPGSNAAPVLAGRVMLDTL